MSDTTTTNQHTSTINQRPRFRVSIETRTLYDRISQMAVGDVVTYEELSELLGVEDVRTSSAPGLGYARKMAQRDHQIVTDTVRGIGLKRLTDSETVASSSGTFNRIRRAAKRGMSRITAVEFDALPNEDKIKHNAAASAFGVLQMFSKPKALKKIEAAVNSSQTGQLPIGRTLELFHR